MMSGTGLAGLTLGGGLGWLGGRFGPACDNLVAAEVVTARGDVLQVSADDHPDLLWGLRGGGGNLGVVTAFTHALHPVWPVLAGGLVHPWSAARDVMRFHDTFVATAPDELATAVSLFPTRRRAAGRGCLRQQPGRRRPRPRPRRLRLQPRRLAALKATYDPDNVFRLNQNVPRAGHAARLRPPRSPTPGGTVTA